VEKSNIITSYDKKEKKKKTTFFLAWFLFLGMS